MSKGWTPERREAQRQRCLQNKPSQHSTGPKTKAGKARASMNAFKYGGDTRLHQLTNEILKHNREFLKAYKEFTQIELIKPLEKQVLMRGRVYQSHENELKARSKPQVCSPPGNAKSF